MKSAQIYEEAKRRVETQMGDERDAFILDQMTAFRLQLTLKAELQRRLDAVERALAEAQFLATESEALKVIQRVSKMASGSSEGATIQ